MEKSLSENLNIMCIFNAFRNPKKCYVVGDKQGDGSTDHKCNLRLKRYKYGANHLVRPSHSKLDWRVWLVIKLVTALDLNLFQN